MPVPRSALFALALLSVAACKPGAAAPAAAAATAGPAMPPPAAPDSSAAAAVAAPIPLDGIWRQASVTCSDGRVPTEKVDELAFDGATYSVTYVPFETYKDYWGKVRFDFDKGEMDFTVDRGNFVPDGLDLVGKVELETNTLTMHEVWFGDRVPGAPPGAGCTYVFSRYLGGE